jgi:hypothetical protein
MLAGSMDAADTTRVVRIVRGVRDMMISLAGYASLETA